MPLDKDEVSIKRTFNLKEDKFLLDGKVTTKTEINNIMEASGFSRNNPYYIVQQGKVTELANKREQEYFELLKEVAGTRVYEASRNEAVKCFEEAVSKGQRVEEVVSFINDKLNDLKLESDE